MSGSPELSQDQNVLPSPFATHGSAVSEVVAMTSNLTMPGWHHQEMGLQQAECAQCCLISRWMYVGWREDGWLTSCEQQGGTAEWLDRMHNHVTVIWLWPFTFALSCPGCTWGAAYYCIVSKAFMQDGNKGALMVIVNPFCIKSRETGGWRPHRCIGHKVNHSGSKGKQKAALEVISKDELWVSAMQSVNLASQELSNIVRSGWKKSLSNFSKTTLSNAKSSALMAEENLCVLRRICLQDMDMERAAVSILGKLVTLDMVSSNSWCSFNVWRLCSPIVH